MFSFLLSIYRPACAVDALHLWKVPMHAIDAVRFYDASVTFERRFEFSAVEVVYLKWGLECLVN